MIIVYDVNVTNVNKVNAFFKAVFYFGLRILFF